MVTVKVEGRTLNIERIVEGASGKVTAILKGGQEITYRPPAATAIRDAFKSQTPATPPAASVQPPAAPPRATKSARRLFTKQ